MVLSIKQLSGAAAAQYYEGEAAKTSPARSPDEYYTAADPSAHLTRWWSPRGQLAPDGGAIRPGELQAALDGIGRDGAKLVQAGSGKARVSGWDGTFSAPKDVAALYAAADPATRRALLEDVAASAAAGLRALHEAGAFETRRGKGGAAREVAADVMAAVFPQATNRAGAPQLHAHAVVVNAGLRRDGTTGALDVPGLFAWKTHAGAVFRAELAHRLEKRGLAIEADGQFFRIAGAPRELAEHWSSRRAQILGATADGAGAGGKAKRLAKEQAAQATRRGKDTVPADADLDRRWLADMALFGLSPAGVWDGARGAAERHRRPEGTAAEAALAEALERRSITTERELRRLVAEATQTRGGGAEAAKAEADLLLSGGRLVALRTNRDGERVFSTRATLERERRMILDAAERRDEPSIITAKATEAAIARRPTLSEEQVEAVRHTTGKGGVVAVEGLAGAGKSFALGAVADAARDSGAAVVGLAPSWEAAEVVRGDAALPGARAIQGFVQDLDAGRVRFGREPAGGGERGVAYTGARVVVILDEAGMASTADTASLLAHARDAGVKVILSGDRGQLGSVEPGAAFAAVADTIGVARMEEVRRQEVHGWQREASAAFGNGDGVAALAAYEAKGRVVFADDADDAIRRVADAWDANREAHPGASRLVLAGRNAEVHALNAELRGRVLAAGELGAEAITLRTLHAGGRRDGHGEAREMEVRAGDRVALGATLTKTGRNILRNDLATVRGFTAGADPTLVLRVDRTGEVVALRASELAPVVRKGGEPSAEERLPVLQHGYARTVHKAQGKTVDFAVVLAGAGLDRARAYVSMTRHRKDAVMVADGGAIRERLAADGRKADAKAIRDAFLHAARRSLDGQNASDHVADRGMWLKTGDPHATAEATKQTGIRQVMRRAARFAVGLAERVQTAARAAERAASRERGGVSMGR